MLVFVYGYYNDGQQGYTPQITPINIDPDTPDQPSDGSKTIIFELKEADAPNTCANFKKYVQDEYFDGLIFHRVMNDFMIQGGGFYPGMTEKQTTYPPINLEISQNLRHIDGAVAMARTNDENSATSQFYICDGSQTSLDNSYAVFGQVVSGMDVVRSISAVQTTTVAGHNDVPANDVTILSARLGTQDGKTYVTLVVDF
ncbi:MAG: peptidylprolyl isomerase [Thermoplasmata archaeon]|nr:peptidylprolyl isomerase [Thermoplasmata archaeon]